ncbi:MAG: ATP-grasp domain-containing protein, partial [Planctomycetaceae bacterium]|nr:ATP-grasp domain-containing protein [Planctomycetaceae bacterium]
MKTVFVSEYLCSGAWPEDELPASLVTEGRSMLEALCEDLLACDYKVCTTRDRRGTLSHLSGLEITDVDSPTQEWEAFGELAKQCDATLVIAPELDEILTQRIEWLEQNKLNHFMSSVDSTQTGSDKLLFSQFCLKHNLPTPETFLLHEPSAQQTKFPCPFPFVIKPQFGAGTTMTAVINSLEDWQDFSARRVSEADFPPYIIQPIVCGNFVSTACIISPDGKQTDWLPVGQQLFEDLQYQGGNIPYHHALNDQLCEIAEKVISNLPGLRGYIGLDFLLATDSEHPIQILEINPRLTTSYLGYRMLTKDSLAR